MENYILQVNYFWDYELGHQEIFLVNELVKTDLIDNLTRDLDEDDDLGYDEIVRRLENHNMYNKDKGDGMINCIKISTPIINIIPKDDNDASNKLNALQFINNKTNISLWNKQNV